jgi:hypothetical protein
MPSLGGAAPAIRRIGLWMPADSLAPRARLTWQGAEAPSTRNANPSSYGFALYSWLTSVSTLSMLGVEGPEVFSGAGEPSAASGAVDRESDLRVQPA